ncbi:MAG: hydroxyacid dehydrogenase [Rhodospirillaceae bacterium]|nr:hydroxyacid dehydrogenase [Rhodospirillaceae bacterium]MDD9928068.1 hydroxyacid dehydrogenase [Rhodospirillaceae bacterium]
MAEIIITEFIDQSAVDDLSADFDVVYDPQLVDQPERLLSLVGEAPALIVRNRTQVRGALLEAATALKVVGRLGVGLDNIDMSACAARGITVCPATGANNVSVAEYVVTTMTTLLRSPAYSVTEAVLAGSWPRTEAIGREASGKVLGLVGFGAIGRDVARRAAPLGVTVTAHDPLLQADDPAWAMAESKSLDTLIAESDVISLHVPLTDETHHLLDAAAIARMKPGAIVINAARGGVVDEVALAEALKEGRLGGGALDVFETEPVTAESGTHLAKVPNLILTPHIAGLTDEANLRTSDMTAANVRRVLEETR